MSIFSFSKAEVEELPTMAAISPLKNWPQQKEPPAMALKFLQSCVVCGGIRYRYEYQNKRFHCVACVPGAQGIDVEAGCAKLPITPSPRPKAARQANPPKRNIPIPAEAQRAYDNGGAAWCIEHKKQLLAAGWGKSDLFRRGKFKYPYGNWGLAYSTAWLKPEVQAELRKDGTVVFKWERGGKEIVQTSSVPHVVLL